MDIREIKKIVEMMKENDLTEFEMEDQGFRLGVKRRSGAEPIVVQAAPAPMVAAPAMIPATAPAGAPASPPAVEDDADLEAIKSPIVGTFYRAASPDADPFVSVGSTVEPDTVVCIVEAMKVMNEIKAEVRGVIRKILVENAAPVQFGQPLFKIEPL
ncbi:MAG: acetyl-CoA carboxylase biotin carboxyl carrier protein [Kiritimatiellae bacterium]|nr:acetyl-CoA carboxylase biotin carboxyl carrier protein [Kiritimatiellia bacterium]